MPLSTIFQLYRGGGFYFIEETRATEKKNTDQKIKDTTNKDQ
jgi:hypothetical protein